MFVRVCLCFMCTYAAKSTSSCFAIFFFCPWMRSSPWQRAEAVLEVFLSPRLHRLSLAFVAHSFVLFFLFFAVT